MAREDEAVDSVGGEVSCGHGWYRVLSAVSEVDKECLAFRKDYHESVGRVEEMD